MERVVLLMATSMVTKMAGSTTLAILATSVTELVALDKKKLCSYSTTVCTRTVVLIAPFIGKNYSLMCLIMMNLNLSIKIKGATAVIRQLIPQTTMAILSIIASLCMAFVTSPRTITKPTTKSSEIHDPNYDFAKFNVVKTAV